MISSPSCMSVSALAAAAAVAVFSPSSRQGVKKTVAPSRYRYDPYSAKVLPRDAINLSALQQFATPMEFTPYPAPVHHQSRQTSSVSSSPLLPVIAATSDAVAPTRTPSPRFAMVEFKHTSATFLAPFRILVGDLVVVEGDRGENIGLVREITKEVPSYDVPNKVLRRATEQDRQALAAQRDREASAVMSTRAVAEQLQLPGRIEDAEYQFDMKKLTIFVRRPSKGTFVDFRRLQRTLFREFRCRIWCAYMDEVEAAEAAPRCQ
eukprot:CAMPEP_0176434202 /NCGR_PEP_ID=MMETSP0127-20121128/16529_1 /TAXON_ID=938130 /ORGANISM="Platyophrya macrostoma, Strain WH" /LENGTH=263 /DNA_ID=CAMNT_0017816879 /DNA_START=72 /DNA_END=863 /DNA_ORIENTATION=-